NKDGSLQKLTGTAVFPLRYEYGVDASGAYTKTIKLNNDATFSDTPEWTITYSNISGRAYKTTFAPRSGVDGSPPYRQSFLNGKGQLWKEQDADGVMTLYAYNSLGAREYVISALSATARTITYDSLRAQ